MLKLACFEENRKAAHMKHDEIRVVEGEGRLKIHEIQG
jgi:hypothetical protein